MSRSHLTVVVLQDVAHRSLQHARTSAATRIESCRVLAQLVSRAAGFDPDHLDCCVAEERMKQPDRIRTAANARDEQIRQTAFAFENLRACLAPNDALIVSHHQRIRMWSKRAAE